MASPGSRNRRPQTLEEHGILGLDGTGHKEKLPRPGGPIGITTARSFVGTPSARGASSPRSPGRSPEELSKSASTRYLAPTTQAVMLRPRRLAERLPVPLAAICCPFADGYDEMGLPLAEPGPDGPLRCPRCACYANSFFKWSGREPDRMHCNMCDQLVQVSESMLEDLDRSGRCADGREHPELTVGSVDLAAPGNYDSDRPACPSPPVLMVALELSRQSVQSGFTKSMLEALLQLIDVEDPVLQRRVCLITFGDAVEFYAPTRTGNFRIVAMQSVSDPFVPLSVEALFLDMNSEASLCQFRSLLEHLWNSVQNPAELGQEASECPVGGAALRAAVESVTQAGGGDVWMCYASSPSGGVGALKAVPDHVDTAGVANKMAALQQSSFHEDTLALCVRGGVAVSAVLAPAQGIALDVQTLRWLPGSTGGDSTYLEAFDPSMHYARLLDELRHWVKKMSGSAYSCVFKIRCSKGLEIASRMSPWPSHPSSEEQPAFELARWTPDMSVAYSLRPQYDPDDDGSPARREDRRTVYIQTVVLYTNAEGRRLLRVHTVGMSVVSSIGAVFRNINLGPLVSVMVKQAASAFMKQGSSSSSAKVTKIKDGLLDSCADILGAFRAHCCASYSSANGLLTPRDLALLPLYTLAARKIVFALTCDGAFKDADDLPRLLVAMPVQMILLLLYPRIYPLEGGSSESGALALPQSQFPCLQDSVAEGSSPAYLIVNGRSAVLCIVDKDRFSDESSARALWESAQVMCRAIGDGIHPNPCALTLSEIPLQLDSATMTWPQKVALSTFFVEDDGAGDMSYAHWVQHVQRRIRRSLDMD